MTYSKVLVNLQIDEKYSIYRQYHNLLGCEPRHPRNPTPIHKKTAAEIAMRVQNISSVTLPLVSMYSFNDFSLSSDITYVAILEPMVSP